MYTVCTITTDASTNTHRLAIVRAGFATISDARAFARLSALLSGTRLAHYRIVGMERAQ